MSNYNVPAQLLEQCGTYAGETDLIGKRVVIVQEPDKNPLVELLEAIGQEVPDFPTYRLGAEGTVIHVDSTGFIWVDFGDDERADVRHTPEGDFRIYDVGNVDETREDIHKLYALAE